MELGIKAKEIMNMDFLLLDSSLTLETCMKKLNKKNKDEVCVILHEGYLHNILSYDDLLKIFLKRKTKNLKLKDIARKNFPVVDAETDVFDVIMLMRKGKDFVVVKGKEEIGLITKKEIAEVNQLLFDEFIEKIRESGEKKIII